MENDPLLDQLEARRDVAALTVPQLLGARELRTPLAIICLAMASQQLSGRFYFVVTEVLILTRRQVSTQVILHLGHLVCNL